MTTSYDTRFDQTPAPVRASFSTVPSSQPRNNSVYDTQQVSKRTYVDAKHPGASISRTEYAIRPRRESTTSETRRPLSSMAKNVSPTRERPEPQDSGRDMVIYKQPREDSAPRLLQPVPSQSRGSAHHQRHNSATRAETGRYFGAAAPRVERSYHSRGPYVEKVAESRPVSNATRYIDEPAIEYTGPREQFDRDFPTRARRESLSRRERPSSAMDTKFEQLPFRRDNGPPPSASRQLQRIERDDRRSGFESDPDRSREPARSQRHNRGPVVHQREDGYSSNREDYDLRRPTRPRSYDDDVAVAGSKSRYREDGDRERDRHRRDYEREEDRPNDRDKDRERDREKEKYDRRSDRPRDREHERERERHRPRDYEVVEEDEQQPRRSRRRNTYDDREPSPDHSKLKAIAATAAGGLAAAGIVSKRSGKDDDASDSDGKRERRRRHRKTRERREGETRDDEDVEAQAKRRERRSHRENKDDSSGSDTPDEDARRRRPASRTRQRRDTQDGNESDREKAQAALTAPPPDRRPSREPDSSLTRDEPPRDQIPDRSKQESPTTVEGRTLSPGEGEDGRPRKVSIVEPVKLPNENKPKGILKPPREVPFPEDPNPTREGVAPLKQAGKDGIPTGARWTKISRILVNPEALQKAQERFEEREDYVIVLRVLNRDEIEKLAENTKEIRGNSLLPYKQDHSY